MLNKTEVDDLRRDYEAWPRLEGVSILWHHEWYDGIVSWLCDYQGQRLWFHMCADYLETDAFKDNEDVEGELPWYRRYLCHRPILEQLTRIEDNHAKWQRMAEPLFFDDDGRRFPEPLEERNGASMATASQYYAEAAGNPEPEGLYLPATVKHIVGWFED